MMRSRVAVLGLVISIVLATIVCSSQSPREQKTGVVTAVSIEPLAYFVEQVGGDHVTTMVLVKPGQSPATYEPTPRQMAELSDADVFFAVGVPYEKSVLPRLVATIPDLPIVATQKGIEFLSATSDQAGDEHDHGGHDPHIWLDPRLAKRIAASMRDELIRLDPSHAAAFRENFDLLARQLDSLYAEIHELLLPYQGRHFAAYHPAWGYFARAFGIVQLEIAIGGKVPGPREVAELLDDVKRFELRGLIVQPQFKSGATDAIAKAMGVPIVELDPLARDYESNLINVAETMTHLLGGP